MNTPPVHDSENLKSKGVSVISASLPAMGFLIESDLPEWHSVSLNLSLYTKLLLLIEKDVGIASFASKRNFYSPQHSSNTDLKDSIGISFRRCMQPVVNHSGIGNLMLCLTTQLPPWEPNMRLG